MATQIQLRRDTQSNWSSANTVLALGEIGYATDLYKFKIGDGSTAWNSLTYQGYTLVADDSTGTLISNGDDFKIAGGDSISTSVSGNTLTIDLDETITVDAISSTDSTAVQINDGLNVSGTLSADTIDTNTISSSDSSGVFINDDLFVSGSIKAEGSTAIVFKDKVSVNEIIPDDSSAVQISNLDVSVISSHNSTAIQINESVNISGTLSVDTIDTNTISSTDSGAIQINDGLNVSGTLSADTIDTNTISSSDSSAIQINDAVNISGTLSANTIDVNTLTSGDSSGININDTNLYINGNQVFARNQAGDIALTNSNSDISQFVVNASGTFNRIAASNINVSSFNNDAGYATATGGGFINSTLTSFPTAGDSTALDLSESANASEPGGVGSGAGDTTDAFGVALGATFDNMEPVGRTESSDFGDGEAYVGA